MAMMIVESFSNVDENIHTRQHKIIMCWADVQSENLLCKMFSGTKRQKKHKKQTRTKAIATAAADKTKKRREKNDEKKC